jgi:hypothetical protein
LASTEAIFYDGYFNYKQILKEKPTGTPPLVEDELKYNISAPKKLLNNNSYILASIKEQLDEAVKNKFIWQAPKFTNTIYTVGEVGMGSFCFVDVYLDTEDNLNRKLSVVYRVRYRWHSIAAFKRYLLGSRVEKDMPHRCEYQFKSYEQANSDKSIASDISWAVESRFEYRNDSQPFKQDNSAPKGPWPFEEFIGYAIKGRYKSFTPFPSYEYAKVLNAHFKNNERVKLKPALVNVILRRRIHLTLDNEFGKTSGTKGFGSVGNFNQSILTTVDTVNVYSPKLLNIYKFCDIHGNGKQVYKRLKKRLKSNINEHYCGSFSEVEFEFERNVLSALNTQIKELDDLSAEKLEEVKKAFVSDVNYTSKVVLKAMNNIGLKTELSKINKYSKATDLINAKNAKQ